MPPVPRALALVVSVAALLVLAACGSSDSDSADSTAGSATGSTTGSTTGSSTTPTGLDVGNFLDDALAEEVTTEDCTLSGGDETTCYSITVAGYPADHDTGPFCPATITDGADAGGIWFDGESVYDIDGPFIKGLATTYDDDNWHMYDDEGNVLVTETAAQFEAAARPDVDPALQNHCVEGRLAWLENGEPITTTVLIPVSPVAADSSAEPQGNQGVTLDGVVIAESAPVDAILGAYTIAAFDDCGGHYNPVEGYHMHGAVGCSEVGEAADGDPPIFGYAMDGYAVHSPFEAGEEPADLDGCNGHTTDADGYHYHANSAEKNQVVQCLMGQTVAGTDPGAPPGGPPAPVPATV